VRVPGTQLRIYRIEPGRLDDFAREWAGQVRPLRERLGFRVDGAWTVPEEDTFVWIVSHRGPGSFDEANQAYYDSPERKAFDPDPARLIAEVSTLMLEPVEP
jgi:hypothetical protein